MSKQKALLVITNKNTTKSSNNNNSSKKRKKQPTFADAVGLLADGSFKIETLVSLLSMIDKDKRTHQLGPLVTTDRQTTTHNVVLCSSNVCFSKFGPTLAELCLAMLCPVLSKHPSVRDVKIIKILNKTMIGSQQKKITVIQIPTFCRLRLRQPTAGKKLIETMLQRSNLLRLFTAGREVASTGGGFDALVDTVCLRLNQLRKKHVPLTITNATDFTMDSTVLTREIQLKKNAIETKKKEKKKEKAALSAEANANAEFKPNGSSSSSSSSSSTSTSTSTSSSAALAPALLSPSSSFTTNSSSSSASFSTTSSSSSIAQVSSAFAASPLSLASVTTADFPIRLLHNQGQYWCNVNNGMNDSQLSTAVSRCLRLTSQQSFVMKDQFNFTLTSISQIRTVTSPITVQTAPDTSNDSTNAFQKQNLDQWSDVMNQSATLSRLLHDVASDDAATKDHAIRFVRAIVTNHNKDET